MIRKDLINKETRITGKWMDGFLEKLNQKHQENLVGGGKDLIEA